MIATARQTSARAGISISLFGPDSPPGSGDAAARYCRGLIRSLRQRGHRVTLYGPDAPDRRGLGDIPGSTWTDAVSFPADSDRLVLDAVEQASDADVVIKASGGGVHDALLECAVLALRRPARPTVFWDLDPSAALPRVEGNPADPLRKLIPRYDLVLTRGGGDPVVRRYRALGAPTCIPVYSAMDPDTHHPVDPDPRFTCDLALLGDRHELDEARVDEFFFRPAAAMPDRSFLLGGAGWDGKALPPNVHYLGHVPAHDHNALFSTPLAVLAIGAGSDSAARFSPAPALFEAAGSGAAIITDAWEGVEHFLEPGSEVLVAGDGDGVVRHLRGLDLAAAAATGDRARRRVLREHTYAHRAEQLEAVLGGRWSDRPLVGTDAADRTCAGDVARIAPPILKPGVSAGQPGPRTARPV